MINSSLPRVKQLSSKQVKSLQEKILFWYKKNKRDLPWRQSRDPYRILVSEVMLQQTQVSRVIPKYIAWFEAFPTLEALANAPTSEVLHLWSGLGYNRRALFLQKTAKAIVTEHHGIWPKTIADLKKLPGIGDYTAAAIACFAFDAQVAVVDTNIRKVILIQIYRYICNEKDGKLPAKDIQAIADQLLPLGKAYDWNQALMDYAAAELKKEKILIPKQSKFKGSNRYFRGKILKLLLKHHTLDEEALALSLQEGEGEFDDKKLASILSQLEKDGFIKKGQKKIRLIED